MIRKILLGVILINMFTITAGVTHMAEQGGVLRAMGFVFLILYCLEIALAVLCNVEELISKENDTNA